MRGLGDGAALPPPAEMLTVLDDVERLRAARYGPSVQSASFITGRYLLRLLAAGIVGAEPQDLLSDFSCPVCGPRGARSDHGRPGYTLEGSRLPVALSLSRTADATLLGALDLRDAHGVGTSDGVPRASIGVDIDAVSGVLFGGFDDVALSPAERRFVAALPTSGQDTARARLWVRKEALVKAQGTGFSTRDPADVEVLADPRITDLTECGGVLFEPLGFVAAVAVL